MIIANFQVENKANKSKFFKKIFLIANTKFEMILEIFFLKISNTNISFGKKTLIQKSYITIKALSITKQISIVDLKKFVIAVLNTNSKTFIIYVAIQK